ncbi:hypothetical protein MT349_19785 [Rathayibacter caricis]|uniref:hypothetical protein n=1 Tax=Rathayibacter caricis TaxID=110936 RepID=UPI001FB26770|nr:hypothetical protein [Rathayibacter caricis]MCJ1698031.1 hypothetical protein [Rathayibacter caricis]
MAAERFTPGTPAPNSGQYQIVGPRGGTRGGAERTSIQNKPLPPTPNPGERYVFVDGTNNGAGKRR